VKIKVKQQHIYLYKCIIVSKNNNYTLKFKKKCVIKHVVSIGTTATCC